MEKYVPPPCASVPHAQVGQLPLQAGAQALALRLREGRQERAQLRTPAEPVGRLVLALRAKVRVRAAPGRARAHVRVAGGAVLEGGGGLVKCGDLTEMGMHSKL